MCFIALLISLLEGAFASARLGNVTHQAHASHGEFRGSHSGFPGVLKRAADPKPAPGKRRQALHVPVGHVASVI
jgi:hypothetical protein